MHSQERKEATTLITGIAGSIGQAIASRLARVSHRVVGLDIAGLPSNMAEWVSTHNVGSIADIAFLERALNEANAVVHLAGWVHAVPRNEQEKRKIFSLNHEATREIARICKSSDKKLVFASTVAVYGDDASGKLSEDTPTIPSSAYGESKLLAEQHVLDAGGTVLRLPMVYGAHDKGNMARMIRAIRKRRFAVPGAGRAAKTFAGRWNVAEAIACALKKDEARGRMFLVTDDEDTTLTELCDLIAELAGCARPLRLPSSVVASAALTGSALKRLMKKNMPVDWSSYCKLARELSFDGSRIRKVLGYRPAKSFREGLAEEVNWIVEHNA